MKVPPNTYTSLTVSLELKRHGFPQKSEACYNSIDRLVFRPIPQRTALCTASFTIGELFDALPHPGQKTNVPNLYTGISRGEGHRYYCHVQKTKIYGSSDSMPDAVAMAIIALLKKGKLDFRPAIKAPVPKPEPHPESLAGMLQEPKLWEERRALVDQINRVPVTSVEFDQLRDQIQAVDVKIEAAKISDEALTKDFFRGPDGTI